MPASSSPSQFNNINNNNNNNNNNNKTNNNGNSGNCNTKKKPFLFLTNLLRRKKVLEIDDLMFDREMNHRARSEPSVISYNCTPMGAPNASSPSIATLNLTPGRCRDIDQDMQALRLSRQDNPFIQKVLASRESLVDTIDDSVSDDAILMSEEFNSELESDPFTLPEVQEHMIRSPPPTSWPRSPHFNAFNFSNDNGLTISSQSSEESTLSVRTIPKLNEMFLATRSHSTMSENSLTQHFQNKKKNGILLKEHLGISIPRPHSSHHSETRTSHQHLSSRPLSHCDGPLSVRHFK